MIERFTLGKDYDCDGNWEYCYEDNETGRKFNFAYEFCHTDFLKAVNIVIDNLRKENKELQEFKDKVFNSIDKTIEGETQIAENIESTIEGDYVKAVNRLTIIAFENLKKELSE